MRRECLYALVAAGGCEPLSASQSSIIMLMWGSSLKTTAKLCMKSNIEWFYSPRQISLGKERDKSRRKGRRQNKITLHSEMTTGEGWRRSGRNLITIIRRRALKTFLSSSSSSPTLPRFPPLVVVFTCA